MARWVDSWFRRTRERELIAENKKLRAELDKLAPLVNRLGSAVIAGKFVAKVKVLSTGTVLELDDGQCINPQAGSEVTLTLNRL